MRTLNALIRMSVGVAIGLAFMLYSSNLSAQQLDIRVGGLHYDLPDADGKGTTGFLGISGALIGGRTVALKAGADIYFELHNEAQWEKQQNVMAAKGGLQFDLGGVVIEGGVQYFSRRDDQHVWESPINPYFNVGIEFAKNLYIDLGAQGNPFTNDPEAMRLAPNDYEVQLPLQFTAGITFRPRFKNYDVKKQREKEIAKSEAKLEDKNKKLTAKHYRKLNRKAKRHGI